MRVTERLWTRSRFEDKHNKPRRSFTQIGIVVAIWQPKICAVLPRRSQRRAAQRLPSPYAMPCLPLRRSPWSATKTSCCQARFRLRVLSASSSNAVSRGNTRPRKPKEPGRDRRNALRPSPPARISKQTPLRGNETTPTKTVNPQSF